MAALEDSFLRDLEDLSDDSEAEEEDRDAALPEHNEVRRNVNDVQEGCWISRQGSLASRRLTTFMQLETEEVDIGDFDTLESRARLQSSERYRTIMKVPFPPALQAPLMPTQLILAKCSAQHWSAMMLVRVVTSQQHPRSLTIQEAPVQRVHQALESGGEMAEERSWAGPSEEDPTYQLLVDCNQLAVDIDNEIAIVHIFMRDKYK